MTIFSKFSKETIMNPKNWYRGTDTKDCVLSYNNAFRTESERRIAKGEMNPHDFENFGNQIIFDFVFFEDLSPEEQTFIYNNCIVDKDE